MTTEFGLGRCYINKLMSSFAQPPIKQLHLIVDLRQLPTDISLMFYEVLLLIRYGITPL